MVCSKDPLNDDPSDLTEEQRKANILYLKTYIDTLNRDNAAELGHMGFAPAQGEHSIGGAYFPPGSPMRAQVIIKQLNFVHWELCKLLRWSTPRRVSEAIPSLEWLMNFQRLYMSKDRARRDLVIPSYLAVGLSDSGRHEEAERSFTMVATAIANNPDHELRREAIMWMEAARARNLRFLGRVDEALPIENELVEKFMVFPHKWGPTTIAELVLGPGDSPHDSPIMRRVTWIPRCTRLLIRTDMKPYKPRDKDGNEYHLPPKQIEWVLRNIEDFRNRGAANSDFEVLLYGGSTEVGMNSIPHGRHNEPTIITDNAYLLSDPSEINQEDTKECWLTRCGKTKDLKLCIKCHTARYCSREHQVKAWPLHKINCKAVYREGLAADKQALPLAPATSTVDEQD